ncbi:MAG: hypothetical protein QOF76_1696 [Solirubrobacteraceae bacterium]|jgi:AcrR family transcriptional regulator|nr:hypothetical protein [Solirubrobacteraceae bacterium]
MPVQERALRTRQKLLDATVEELLEHGYAALSTAGVARRARVSRGAQQHHFPFKDELVIEAVRELVDRQLAAWREEAEDVDLATSLDITLDAFSGPLFAAVLELTLAARDNEGLTDATTEAEATLTAAIQRSGRRLLADLPPAEADLRWAMAIGTVRGFAMLRLFGRPSASVKRQWAFAREKLVAMLVESPA